MNKRTRSQPNRQILEEASTWFVDFRVGDVDSHAREEFHHWLQRSPEHIQAYLEIAGTYAELPLFSGDGKLDVQALIAHARSVDDNVIPLAVPESESPSLEVRGSGPSERLGLSHPSRSQSENNRDLRSIKQSVPEGRVRLAVAASILLMIAAASTWLYIQRETYSTQIGEQRSLTLADGSTVELNSRSSIRVRYTEHERHIDLVEGQALFRVAKSKARPFIVRTGDTLVRAVGTEFDVYRKRRGTVVTVVEGRVSITSPEPESESQHGSGFTEPQGSTPSRGDQEVRSTRQVFLAAGEQLIVTHASIAKPTRANIAAATAWTARQLIFDATPLSEVAEEFNRYNTRRLIIDTHQIYDFNVSGTYSSTNPDSLLRFLRAQPGITLIESDREIRVTHE